MRPHWEKCLIELGERLTRLPQLVVASDFDGTLSPLVDEPARAALSPGSRQVLVNLAARHPRVRLGFSQAAALRIWHLDWVPVLSRLFLLAIMAWNCAVPG